MDKENASFDNALASISEILETRAVPVQIPIGKEDQFTGVVDVIQGGAFLEPNGNTPIAKSDVPDDLAGTAEEYRESLVEVAAESDDELIEKFFEGELSEEEIQDGLQTGIIENQFVPVLCGSALKNIGVQQLMDMIISCCPSPIQAGEVHDADDESKTREPSTDAPLSAVVFKTIADPFSGQLSLFRVYSGTLEGDSQVNNSNRGEVGKAR